MHENLKFWVQFKENLSIEQGASNDTTREWQKIRQRNYTKNSSLFIGCS